MNLVWITVTQVAELFLLIFLGFLSVKAKLLQKDYRKSFSDLLVYLIVPAMIINSYRTKLTEEIFHNIFLVLGLSFLAIFFAILLSRILTLPMRTDERRPILVFALEFSNAGYMGFPLAKALFGEEGLLYASIFVTVFNILLWTVGYSSLNKGGSRMEIVRSLAHNPVIYAVIFGLVILFFRISIPEILAQPISLLGNMNTPVAMIITGMIMGSSDLMAMLKNRKIWFVLPIRMLLIPILTFLLFYLMGVRGMAAQVVLILAACPTAAITSVFAVKYGHDEELAAGSVVLTTLGSILTLPVLAYLLSTLL